jgi:hypothetical protein
VVGADFYASSLHEAVGICLDVATGQDDIGQGDVQATAA